MMKKLISRIGCLALAVVLSCSLLSLPAMAADAGASAAARQEDLDTLYTQMKAIHPNLFANTGESVFLARKAEIEKKLATESDFDFALDCASLAALVKDSHTSVSLGSSVGDIHYCEFDLDWYDGTWVLAGIDKAHKDLLGQSVTAIGGLSMDKVLEKFSTFLSADNSVKLRKSFWQMCYVRDAYEYLGIAEAGQPLTITVTGRDGKPQTLSTSAVDLATLQSDSFCTLSALRTGRPATAADKTKYYWATSLNADTYYIQYNQCFQDPSLSMQDFAAQVKSALSAGHYSRILIDLRNNGGGSDGVISPLLEELMNQRDKGVQIVCLIGQSTFSSAIINAVELSEMGAVLAGEATSGSVSHFGSIQSFKLPNSGLNANVSTKYIDMSGYFDAAALCGVNPLQPDVSIPQTTSDYLAGKDTCVETILADPSILKTAEKPDAVLTRGRFVAQLYTAAGSPSLSPITEQPFEDTFGFEWYLPALVWGKAQHIALGLADGSFRSARVLSWQEAAVFLTRAATAEGKTPAAVRSSAVPAALARCRNVDAVTKAWQWGLLPENADYAHSPSRAQGAAMAQALAKLK